MEVRILFETGSPTASGLKGVGARWLRGWGFRTQASELEGEELAVMNSGLRA